MPMVTGGSLLTNMFWQICLKIKHYDKSMRVGTIILVCAVSMLPQLGPQSPAELDVFELLSQRVAQAWVAALVIGSLIGICASYTTINYPMGSWWTLCSITSV